MAEEALDDEEQDEEDCPKCPPAGALLGWQHLPTWRHFLWRFSF